MNIKKVAIAVAVSAALGLAGQAQAAEGAFAAAELTVSNFALGTSTAGVFTAFNATQFQTLTVLDTATNNALLNGTPAATFDSSGVLGATVNALQACVGTCGAQNVFTQSAVPPTTLFARSDSLLTGAPITVGAVPAGAQAQTIGEVSLPGGNNFGNANSQINLTTTLNFVLNTTISNAAISFNASDFLRAWTAAGSAVGTLAGANLAWSINLSGPNGVLMAWSPDGVVNGSNTGLTELNDSCNLAANASASFNQPNGTVSCSGAFLAVANGVTLLGGVNYSLNIQHSSQANARTVTAVPEPASIALLGIGLLGLGIGGLRKKSA